MNNSNPLWSTWTKVIKNQLQAKVPTGAIVQPMPYALPWNWKIVPKGNTSAAQYNFCDTIPISCGEGDYYPGSSSFSSNYKAFIEIFSNQATDAEAKHIASDALTQYNDKNTWTNVWYDNEGNNINPRPNWNPSMTYLEWQQSIAANGLTSELSFNLNPVTFQLPTHDPNTNGPFVETQTKGDNSWQPIDLMSSKLQQIAFTSKETSIIAIVPGGWYDSGIVDLYLSKYGKRLLPCRVSAMVVSNQPSFRMKFDQSESKKVTNQILSAEKVRIGDASFDFKKGPNVMEFEGTATAVYPWIVAAVIDRQDAHVETTKSTGLISVKNSGAFVSSFSIQYAQNGKTKTVESGTFPVLVRKTLQLPADATDILVTVKIATFIKTWSVVATYQYDKPVTKSFELTGTTWNPEIKEK